MPNKLPARLYVQWLKEQAAKKRPYWYGTCYDACTKAKLQEKAKQYPEHYTKDRMPRYMADISAGQIAGDCVGGAIKGAAWTLLGTKSKVKNRLGCPDKSADGMFDFCKSKGVEWGGIAGIPDMPCIAVRKPGHVGVYIGSGKVIEWKGFDYGCVETKLSGRGWTHWYKLPWVDYADSLDDGKTTVDPDTGANYRAVKGTRWRVRAEPSETGKVLGYISEPEQVRVYGIVGDWVAVKGGGLKGYISKDALK